MYKFVDTTERASNTPMSIQTFYNHRNLDEELTDDTCTFRTLTVAGRGNVEYEPNTMGIFGMHGVWEDKHQRRLPREINVKVLIETKTNQQMRYKLDALRSLLTGNREELNFTDEEHIYYATVTQLDVPEEESNSLECTITFFCSDPDKYGKEDGEVFINDTAIVDNKGTAETDPIFELTAKKKATFALVTKGDEEYNLIGTPMDVDEVTVNEKDLMFIERGQTLDLWSAAGTAIDGGVVAGRLSTDNDGITVPSYGADTSRWHGPALMRELGTPLQDFEVEMMLEGRTTTFDQTFRIEFYLFDENMRSLGKMAIKDDTLGVYRKKAEARFGPHVTSHQNYLISRHNYQYNWDFFFGMLRMRRKGNNFEFYVTRINNNTKHVYSLKETFSDVDNEFMGRLKYIQIHIGKYGSTERAYGPKINYIKTSKLNTLTVDQTPYILDVGDVVTFDHKDEEILINGEPRNDLKNFGGSFFNLGRGINSLIVHPSDTFDAKVKYRNKYL